MKINYLRAKNFLSIGEIEIDFTKYGNIINIKGENRDHGPGASNGAGKSSIAEIMVYSLFGELMKNLNHTEAVNIKANGKGMEVEMHFVIDSDEYKILRKRSGGKNKLELWKNGTEETSTDTQKEINKAIKLNYTSFINVVCFGQHNMKQFLSCKPADKRSIAENLLSLDKYVKYCEITKKKLKSIQQKIDAISSVYEKSMQSMSAYDKQIQQVLRQQADWKSQQLNTVDRLGRQIELLKSDMTKLVGKDRIENILVLETELAERYKKKAAYAEAVVLIKEKIDLAGDKKQTSLLALKEANYAAARLRKDMEEAKATNKSLLAQDGGKCPVCYGTVDAKNFVHVLKHNQKQIEEYSKEIKEYEESAKSHQSNYNTIDAKLREIKEKYEEIKAKEILIGKSVRELEERKMLADVASRGKADSATLLLEQKISNYKDQIEQKLKEKDPYVEIIADSRIESMRAKDKAEEYKKALSELQEEVPYLEFWIKAFGDDGIRSFILVEVIPLLNNRINYWLQFLVDNKITLNFNKELKEEIKRNPPDEDLFVYNGMSGGEHQRIDLGIALAFAQVMMLTASMMPSIVYLDEVGTNLDRPGIQAVFNTICELAKERQVLVSTHDPDLQEMLSSFDEIVVIKENGYSRLK